MNLWNRLMARWSSRQEPADATLARELREKISERADALTAHLRTYQRSRDPFGALMADMYNRDQLARMHQQRDQP